MNLLTIQRDLETLLLESLSVAKTVASARPANSSSSSSLKETATTTQFLNTPAGTVKLATAYLKSLRTLRNTSFPEPVFPGSAAASIANSTTP
jgi:hypothetical protein